MGRYADIGRARGSLRAEASPFFFSGTSARANPCDSLRGAWADNAEGSKDCELTINTECNRLKGDGFGGLLKVKYLVVLRL